MGKRDVRVIAVPKGVTITLLILVSFAMIAFYFVLSGRAYVRSAGTTEELLVHLAVEEREGTLSFTNAIAILWPVIANALLFMPWGFLAFLALDAPERSRARTYLVTVIGGIVFAAAIQVWQIYLPVPVTTISDGVANAAGTFIGAVGGHLRKQVRIRFDF